MRLAEYRTSRSLFMLLEMSFEEMGSRLTGLFIFLVFLWTDNIHPAFMTSGEGTVIPSHMRFLL
mgnify:CR=1 FL=1